MFHLRYNIKFYKQSKLYRINSDLHHIFELDSKCYLLLLFCESNVIRINRNITRPLYYSVLNCSTIVTLTFSGKCTTSAFHTYNGFFFFNWYRYHSHISTKMLLKLCEVICQEWPFNSCTISFPVDSSKRISNCSCNLSTNFFIRLDGEKLFHFSICSLGWNYYDNVK